MTSDPHEAPTERTERESSGDGIRIQRGQLRMAYPATAVISFVLSVLATAGTAAWAVADRIYTARSAEAAAERAAIMRRMESVEREGFTMRQQLAVDQALLANIQAKLSEINARIAEVQVTLMRDRR